MKKKQSNILDILIYGVRVKDLLKKKDVILYLNEADLLTLVILAPKKTLPQKLNILDLRQLIDMQAINSKSAQTNKNCCLILESKKSKYQFQFSDDSQLENFYLALQQIKEVAAKEKEEQMSVDHTKQLALDLFAKADTDLSGHLSFEEGYELIKKLNVQITKQQLFDLFLKFDHNHDKKIQKDEFISVARQISQKKEFLPLFKKYCPEYTDDKDINFNMMTMQQFIKFLNIEQSQDIYQFDGLTYNRLNQFFYERNGFISPTDFSNLIYNYQNSIFDPLKSIQYQDMNQPLTDYYINSSHNTYLTSNQLTGESSLQAYINAFRMGCRCVELDSWDRNGEPVVTHGFTLTSSLKFSDIIGVIKQYGFTWSKFPVILSIENHCGKEGQQQMAQIMKDQLGDMLYILPENYLEMKYFPSPAQLKRKVIIKSKGESSDKGKIKQQPSLDLDQSQSLPYEYSEDKPNKIKNSIYRRNDLNNLGRLHSNLNENSQEIEEIKENKDENKQKKKKQDIPVENLFSKCVSMIGTSFKNKELDQEHITKSNAFHIVSLSEGKIVKQIKSNEQLIVSFQKRNLTRVYPKGTRVGSSNYDPFPAIQCGAQLIALNFQSSNDPLFIYQSLFQQNGGIYTGYVLKPSFLRHFHTQQTKLDKIDDHSQCNIKDNLKNIQTASNFTTPLYQLKVKIISAQCIKSDEVQSTTINPYVEVTIKGTEADTPKDDISCTNVVQNNAFHPVFEHTEVTFPISCPELAFLVFKVSSKGLISSELIAQYALNFTCIRTGYRIVPLWSVSLKPIPHAMMLVHCEIIKQKV